MRGRGEIPEDVEAMFNEAGKHPNAKKKQRVIIKNLFTKKGGRWVMDASKPFFKQKVTRLTARASNTE